MIENRTFDEIAIGDTASLSRTLTQRDIQLFALVSGDVNPAHLDPEFAQGDMFHHVIAHGMWGRADFAVLGTELPGPGTIYLEQSLRFCGLWRLAIRSPSDRFRQGRAAPYRHARLSVHQSGGRGGHQRRGKCQGTHPKGAPRASLPDVSLSNHDAYRRLMAAAEPPIRWPPRLPIRAAWRRLLRWPRRWRPIDRPHSGRPAARIRATAQEAGWILPPTALLMRPTAMRPQRRRWNWCEPERLGC
jgi:phosphate butyryltransferase